MGLDGFMVGSEKELISRSDFSNRKGAVSPFAR